MRSDNNQSRVNVALCPQYMGLHILSGLLELENKDIFQDLINLNRKYLSLLDRVV